METLKIYSYDIDSESEKMLKQKITAILQTNPDQSLDFTELLSALSRRKNSYPVRKAVWELVSDKVVTVTSDQKFKISQAD